MKYTVSKTEPDNFRPLSTFASGDIIEFQTHPGTFYLIIRVNASYHRAMADVRMRSNSSSIPMDNQINLLNIATNELEWCPGNNVVQKLNYNLDIKVFTT